jgi:hypothetical protein
MGNLMIPGVAHLVQCIIYEGGAKMVSKNYNVLNVRNALKHFIALTFFSLV